METILWKDIVMVGLGAVGSVLGIMNTWNAMSQKRVRLRVTPAFLISMQGEPLGFSIEIINLSSFPLTLSEVGFTIGDGKKVILDRYTIADGKTLPRRVEAREAVSVMFGPTDFPVISGGKIGKAYVRTACGRVITGDSPALREFSQMIAEIAEQRR